MMKQSVKVALSTWLILILTHSSSAITLDIGTTATVNTYSTTLQSLRNQLKDAKLNYFNIPMLPKATNPPKYVLVELKSSQTTSITLALNTNNLYVVGYSDKFNGLDRAHFFPDAPSNAKTTLFPNAKGNLRLTINYDSRYATIEGKAGGGRMKIGLGMQKLKNRVDKVFGVAVNDKTEAEFLLIAVQMVAEAARFVYIENQVRANFNKFEFTQDYKVISLENEWGKISMGVRKADSKTGEIKPPVQIVDANNRKVNVSQVNTIKPDVGILNYVA